MLIKYVRDGENNRVGVVVATGSSKIGWSLCNKLDRFDRKKGLMIAEARANMSDADKEKRDFETRLCNLCQSESRNVDQKIVETLCDDLEEMKERARSYFQ